MKIITWLVEAWFDDYLVRIQFEELIALFDLIA